MNDFSSLIPDSPFSKLIGPSLLIALIVILWWRAGSINIIMERLWRIISGDKKDESESPHLHDEFFKNARNLERFRFVFRVSVKTIEERDNIITWVNYNKIDTRDIQKAHLWIDPNKANPIKSPRKITKPLTLLVGSFVYTLVVLASTFYSQPYAGLIMKESRTWFLAEKKGVRKYFSNESISLEECNKESTEISSRMDFTEKETTAICKAFITGELNTYIDETIKTQKQVFGALTLLFAAALIWILLFARSISAAERIENIVSSKKENT